MNNKLKAQVMGAFFEFLKLDERFWDSRKFSHRHNDHGDLAYFCESGQMSFYIRSFGDSFILAKNINHGTSDMFAIVAECSTESDVDQFASKLNQFYHEFLEREDGNNQSN